MWQLLDQLLVGATELVEKGKGKRKVVPSFIASLVNPPFDLQAEVAEGLIESTCKDKQLLSQQCTENWNRGYPQMSSLEEVVGGSFRLPSGCP